MSTSFLIIFSTLGLSGAGIYYTTDGWGGDSSYSDEEKSVYYGRNVSDGRSTIGEDVKEIGWDIKKKELDKYKDYAIVDED